MTNGSPAHPSSNRAEPVGRLRGGGRTEGHPASRWQLTDFVDLDTLQRLQDGFAELSGAAVSIRDADGRRITQASRPNRFCTLVSSDPAIEEQCRMSNAQAGAQAARKGRPAKYVCHVGLAQYAASIELEGHVLATIVLGDRPEKPFVREDIERMAREMKLGADELWAAVREIQPWSDDQMRAAIGFLQLLANTITDICYRSALLRERVEELTVLEETAGQLSSGFDLDTVLENIVRTMAEVMHVKACSLRLLDEAGKELVINATYGLSPDYLKKGPVLVGENVHDRQALAGEVVRIPDMAADPHVRYPAEARREGLVSSLGVGLSAGGRPLGILHVYTAAAHEFTGEEVRLFRSVAAQAAAAIANSKLLEEHVAKLQLEHELHLASDVQQRMLPKHAPRIPGLDIHAIAQSSRQVGGDFYDFLVMPEGRIGIAVADTVGKSIPAAIMTASVRSALKAQAQNVFGIGDVVRRVNAMLCEDTLPSEFVTLFYGVISAETKRMAYCNAGHEPPLLLRRGDVRSLTTGGPLLGVIRDAEFSQESIQLEPGDALLVYTDGVIDARDYDGRRYGRERLVESLKRHAAEPSYSAEDLALQILWDVRRFAGFRIRTDDLTLLVLRVNAT